MGSWKDGRGRLEVVAEGGPNARLVSARVSDRVEQMAPPDTLYRGNPELGLGEVDQLQTAEEGWTVTVTRTIQQGEESTQHVRNVRYIPRQEIIEMHPCVMSLLTESGAVVPPERSATEEQTGSEEEEAIVCPGPEDEEPTTLPEALYETFPELAPEDFGQTPIEEEGEGEQTPIEEEEEQEEQTPIEEEEEQEEQTSPDPEEGTDSEDNGQ